MKPSYTIFRQMLFWAGNQGNHQNFDPSLITRAVVSGGAGGALASPEFRSSVNPIPTRGSRLCPPHY